MPSRSAAAAAELSKAVLPSPASPTMKAVFPSPAAAAAASCASSTDRLCDAAEKPPCALFHVCALCATVLQESEEGCAHGGASALGTSVAGC
ncbi:hypothetical protein NCG97_07115 [Streptomyces lydicamycinicus]|uniref:Uncharacterized protein n=1 Tax=Streptomyces lydicamycinicus TaxID=1546107 RepID=A0A0P4RFC3_9ACTN|nr:hypothetical protein [Streptomyces lydicamycinicus]USA00502.1 hypothetical protein NCG97_07115 [Streptomyces lydicamycinicus]GAO12425.1 hypothetical protein TPA0598_10_03950 [Streptomyces lydicamycinicus]